jgi:hypothetical protein
MTSNKPGYYILWIDSLEVNGFFLCQICPTRAPHTLDFILASTVGREQVFGK